MPIRSHIFEKPEKTMEHRQGLILKSHGKTLHFTARIITLTEYKAEVEMDLFSEDNHCAKGKGLFVAVKKGHPAYHRW